ncbi:hypothetical protein V8E53_005494 [Lactarius tabidus]
MVIDHLWQFATPQECVLHSTLCNVPTVGSNLALTTEINRIDSELTAREELFSLVTAVGWSWKGLSPIPTGISWPPITQLCHKGLAVLIRLLAAPKHNRVRGLGEITVTRIEIPVHPFPGLGVGILYINLDRLSRSSHPVNCTAGIGGYLYVVAGRMAQSINSFPETDQAMQVFQLRICLLNAKPGAGEKFAPGKVSRKTPYVQVKYLSISGRVNGPHYAIHTPGEGLALGLREEDGPGAGGIYPRGPKM